MMSDLLGELDRFGAWKLNKYTQPFEDGKVLDEYYECSVLMEVGYESGEIIYDWRTSYGATPQLAIQRVLEGEF